jgi:TolA-binding protein
MTCAARSTGAGAVQEVERERQQLQLQQQLQAAEEHAADLKHRLQAQEATVRSLQDTAAAAKVRVHTCARSTACTCMRAIRARVCRVWRGRSWR